MPQVKPNVVLINYTRDPEKTVAAAAKLCYSKSDVTQISEKLTDESAAKFVKHLASLGHESPIEHVSFTFGIEGVSRAFLAQITRHRLASYSVQSQRYVELKDFNYIIPPEVEKDKESLEQFLEGMENDKKYYNSITEKLSESHKRDFLNEGLSEEEAEKKAQKMAIEDARFALPNSCETKMVVTMNARSLKNFFRQRCCNRAQWEIREVAKRMFALVYPIAPNIFCDAGPGCLNGVCPEGAMCCGKSAEVKVEYNKIKDINNG